MKVQINPIVYIPLFKVVFNYRKGFTIILALPSFSGLESTVGHPKSLSGWYLIPTGFHLGRRLYGT